MIAEEKAARYEKDLRNFQESVSIQLSTGARMVDATPIGIRERVKDIQLDLKEKQFVRLFSGFTDINRSIDLCSKSRLSTLIFTFFQSNDQLREKVGRMTETIERLNKLLAESKAKEGDAVSENFACSKRLQETEAQLTTMEILNEGLRKDKNRV